MRGEQMARKRHGVHRRPAVAGGILKRPAHRRLSPKEDEEEEKGHPLLDLRVQDMHQLGPVYLADARYYSRLVQVAGHLVNSRMEEGELFVDMKVTGVKDDDLLRVLSGTPEKRLQVHCCREDCSRGLTNSHLVHARFFEPVDLKRVPWLTNLEAVTPGAAQEVEDEMESLRRLQETIAEADKKPKKEASKKEKKKRKMEERQKEEGRTRESPRKRRGEQVPGQKSLAEVFGSTGLDPDPDRRSRFLKKAKKLSRSKKKKKKKDSSGGSDSESSSSSSSSSSKMEGGAGLFNEEDKLQRIWKKYPGVLTAGAVREARQVLMNQAGTLWEINQSELPPLFTQYCRQQILGPLSVSPALTQEILTLSQALDHLLLGRVSAAADILCQRIKCDESLARGCHWTVGRQLELIHSEQFSIAEGSEALSAARRAKDEEKLKSLLSKGGGAKGSGNYDAGKGRKGKEGKSTGKGRVEEGNRGKGGDGRGRDDGRASGKK